ncbi:MAG: hypothetical protein ACK4SW_07150, partial [Sulfurihydrogenibium azorense]
PKEKAMNGLLPKLQQLFKEHRGDKDVVIHIYDRNFECEIQLHSDFCVNLEDEFKHKLLQYVAERDVMYF